MNIKELEQKIIDLGLGYITKVDDSEPSITIYEHAYGGGTLIKVEYRRRILDIDFSVMDNNIDMDLHVFVKLLKLLDEFEDTPVDMRFNIKHYVLKLNNGIFLKQDNIAHGVFMPTYDIEGATKYTKKSAYDLVTNGYIKSNELLEALMEEYKEDENDEH